MSRGMNVGRGGKNMKFVEGEVSEGLKRGKWL